MGREAGRAGEGSGEVFLCWACVTRLRAGIADEVKCWRVNRDREFLAGPAAAKTKE